MQLPVPACCQELMEILGGQSAQQEVLQPLTQNTEGYSATQKEPGSAGVSVEGDPSDPAQVSAACCPQSVCAAPVLGCL